MDAFFPAFVVIGLLVRPPSGPPLAASELDTILKEWESAASRIRRLDCDFSRFQYDPDFEIEKRGTGSLAVDRTGRAFYKIAPTVIRPGALGRKFGKDGSRLQLQADRAERWYWTSDRVIRVDDVERTFDEFALSGRTEPREFLPEPPALPEDDPCPDDNAPTAVAGQDRLGPQTNGPPHGERPMSIQEVVVGWVLAAAIASSFQKVDWPAFYESFYESIQEFWLARPFLLGMPAAELRMRFQIELLSQTETDILLQFVPKWKSDRVSYSRAVLMLTKEKYKPRALQMFDPDGRETVHVFKDVRVNSNWQDVYLRRDPLNGPDLRGYRSATAVTAP